MRLSQDEFVREVTNAIKKGTATEELDTSFAVGDIEGQIVIQTGYYKHKDGTIHDRRDNAMECTCVRMENIPYVAVTVEPITVQDVLHTSKGWRMTDGGVLLPPHDEKKAVNTMQNLTVNVTGPNKLEECPGSYTVSFNPKLEDGDTELEDAAIGIDCVIRHASGWVESTTVNVDANEDGAITWSTVFDWDDHDGKPTCPKPDRSFAVSCRDTDGKPVFEAQEVTTGIVISITATADFSVDLSESF